MKSFLKVKTPEEIFEIIDQFGPLGEEMIPLQESVGKVLSKDFISPEMLPGFPRSAMDGYAVRAKDTFGASEGLPALFEVVGEVMMGQAPRITVGGGQAVKISTGGMVAEGADGVVMAEYCCLLDDHTLEVTRAIAPLENVIQPGDDIRQGCAVLQKGHRLRPQDLGVMAGLGQTEVPVYRKARVAIISSGDELVPVDEQPQAGQIRDINRFTLGALCQRLGVQPIYMGLSPDNFDALRRLVEKALGVADIIWVSGGSSLGTRDMTLKVFSAITHFELLAHGISIRPGKPTIIGKVGGKPLIGLPGHVASAMIVAEVFLTRLLLRLSGHSAFQLQHKMQIVAKLTRNIESASGREDYVRVRLVEKAGALLAEPIFGKSGLISTLVQCDGLVCVERNTEGLYEGQEVRVVLFDSFTRGAS